MWFHELIQDELPISGVRFNFMPSWWHRNYGIEYGERMAFDPDYRVETHRAMRRIMAERFGDIGLGRADPAPEVIAPDWQSAATAALAGADVEYPPDSYPLSHHVPDELLRSLRAPDDLWSAFPYSQIASQVRYLNDKLGQDVRPQIPSRGVLNEAILIRGPDLFGDLVVEPEEAGRILDYSFGVMAGQVRANFAGGGGGQWMICNCTVVMVGPERYRRCLMHYDRRIVELCEALGVSFQLHHCGKFDDFVETYRHLADSIHMLDIGHESDVAKAMAAFPEAEVSYIVSSQLMINGTPAQVGEKVDRLLDETRGNRHRLFLSVPDIDHGAPDDNLRVIYERLKRAGRR